MTDTAGSYFNKMNSDTSSKKTHLLENQSTAPTHTNTEFTNQHLDPKICDKAIKGYFKKQIFFNILFILQQASFILLQSNYSFVSVQAVQSTILTAMHLYIIKTCYESYSKRFNKKNYKKIAKSVERAHDATLYTVMLYFISLMVTVCVWVVHVASVNHWDDEGLRTVMVSVLSLISIFAQLMLIAAHNVAKNEMEDYEDQWVESSTTQKVV